MSREIDGYNCQLDYIREKTIIFEVVDTFVSKDFLIYTYLVYFLRRE
jgi:hypothetical protein